MPPVTRRGYKNEFKHEVKSDPHSLQGRRPRCHQPRPPQCQHAQQFSGLLSPPSGFSPAAAEPAHRGLDRQIGEHRISSIQLSATAPLREPRPF